MKARYGLSCQRPTDQMTTVHAFMLAIILPLLLGATSSAKAYEMDGIESGISMQRFAELAESRGLEAWEGAGGNWALGKRSTLQIESTHAFCNGRLSLSNRHFDFDVDYADMLGNFLRLYGQPKRVTTEKQAWSGPGGGYISTIKTIWYSKEDRIILGFFPEGRDGRGNLRHTRGAFISYAVKSSCIKDFF